MKPAQLTAFVAVAKHGSIRAAARVLGVTPPAVTKIIRELERELDVSLVERSVKGAALTEEGAVFAPRAMLLLDDMNRARQELIELKEGLQGRIRVAVSTAFAQTSLVPAFQELKRRRPGVTVYFSETGLPGMLARLRDAQIDLAVTHLDPEALDQDFESIPLLQTHLVIGMAKGHPLSHHRHMSDLLAAEWVLPGDSEGVWPATRKLFASIGHPVPDRVIQGDSITAALMFVSRMNMLGIFVEPLARQMFTSLGIQKAEIVDQLPVLQICVIYRRGSKLTPAALQFIDCIRLSLEDTTTA